MKREIKHNSWFQTKLSLFQAEKKSFGLRKHLRNFRKQKKKVFHLFLYQKIGVAIFSLIFVILVITFGPLFQINEIIITRKDPISNIEQAYRSINIYRGKNLIFQDINSIAERIYNGQKSLKNIEINKSFPHTLKISLESFKPIFINENNYILENGALIPNDGTVIDTLEYLDLPNYFSKQDTLNYQELEKIQNLENLLKKNILWITLQYIKFYPKEKEVLFGIENGKILIFDLEKDSLSQIEKLAIFHSDDRDILQTSFIYIDLRVDGKIFFCGAENEFKCRTNLENIYESDFTEILPNENTSQTQL